jgi:hypothetical protein
MEINNVEILGVKEKDENAGLLRIEWQYEKGFGVLNLFINNGKVEIDSEFMSKDFVKQILCKLVDEAKLLIE